MTDKERIKELEDFVQILKNSHENLCEHVGNLVDRIEDLEQGKFKFK